MISSHILHSENTSVSQFSRSILDFGVNWFILENIYSSLILLAPVSNDSYRQFSSESEHTKFEVSEIQTLATTPSTEKVAASLQGVQVFAGVNRRWQVYWNEPLESVIYSQAGCTFHQQEEKATKNWAISNVQTSGMTGIGLCPSLLNTKFFALTSIRLFQRGIPRCIIQPTWENCCLANKERSHKRSEMRLMFDW